MVRLLSLRISPGKRHGHQASSEPRFEAENREPDTSDRITDIVHREAMPFPVAGIAEAACLTPVCSDGANRASGKPSYRSGVRVDRSCPEIRPVLGYAAMPLNPTDYELDRRPLFRSQIIDTPVAATGNAEIEKYEREHRRQLTAIIQRPEILWRVGDKIGKRHLARQ